MKEKKADIFILSSLDDIAWLLNIRGSDVACTPVVLSYIIVNEDEILLFANKEAFSSEIKDKLFIDGIFLRPYNSIYDYVKNISSDKTVILDKKNINFSIVNNIPENVKVLNETNLTLLPKSIKNKTEIENERKAHIKDGVAVTKFMYWIKKNVGKIHITELSAADYINNLRKSQPNFEGLSFNPIIAYAEHGAIMHYSPTEETDVEIKPEGFLLADTGGHYLEGTTDITRTFALGKLTDEQKKYYTAVLRGNLNLASTRFLYGCTGINLDYAARNPLWELGVNYNHGTGHGVGYLLNVHEGPNSIRQRMISDKDESTIFEEGMITSDEPGIYLEGKYGIRLENMIVCLKDIKNEHGQFMKFEHLTYVPFDLDAVEPKYMNEKEKQLLNEYHAKVYENISPYLDEEEKDWLKQATRKI